MIQRQKFHTKYLYSMSMAKAIKMKEKIFDFALNAFFLPNFLFNVSKFIVFIAVHSCI